MDISHKQNKNAYPIKLSYEYTNIVELVKSLKLFKSEYKILDEIHITNTKGVFAVANNAGKKFFMKAKLKNFMSDNDLAVYKLLKKNPHPNINSIEFIYSTDKFILILAEFLEGCDMSNKSYRKHYENNLLNIFEVTLHGLSHLHSIGIIHCDVKLENIMMVPQKDNITGNISYIPIIVDFDCSRLVNDCSVSRCIGTVGCIAPEIANGVVSKKSDLWEMGMLFYYFIFGNNDTTQSDSSSETDDEKIILPKMELINNYAGKYKKIINIIKPMLHTNHEYRPEISHILLSF